MTTEGIYWLDERYPGKPVLGIKHYRAFDRSLEGRTALLRGEPEVDNRPLTFLTSRKTGLVSVYDVSRGEDDLVHMNAPPRCLPCVTPHGGLPIFGWNLFQHPLMDPSHVDVLHLSSRGDINRLHAQLRLDGDTDPSASGRSQGFIWNDDVKELANSDLGVTGSDRLTARESSTVDLGSAYQGGTPTAHRDFCSSPFRSFLARRRRRGCGRDLRCSRPPPIILAKSRRPSRSCNNDVSSFYREMVRSLTTPPGTTSLVD